MTVAFGPDNCPRPIINPFAFSAEEYATRVARAWAAMAAHEIDALLLSDDRNFFYFTGAGGATPREDKARPQFVLIPQSREVIAVVSHARCIPFRESSWVSEVRTYDGLETGRVRDALIQVVKDAPGARVIGMELGYEQRLGMSVADYEALKAACPERRFVDASRLLWGLRMVKSPGELARIERAVRITDTAYQTVFPTLRPGMTEREMAARFHAEMARLGASVSWLVIQTGTYDRLGLVIRDRLVQPGEMIWVDMGANVLGYYADFSRAAILGAPTAHQRDLQQKVREVTQIGMEAIRPGVTLREVARVCDREMEKRGLVFNTWGGRYGHGLGLQVTEPPHVAEYDETMAVVGMALTMEPGMVTPEGRFQIEENFAVTDTGVRSLSQSPREIQVVAL